MFAIAVERVLTANFHISKKNLQKGIALTNMSVHKNNKKSTLPCSILASSNCFRIRGMTTDIIFLQAVPKPVSDVLSGN